MADDRRPSGPPPQAPIHPLPDPGIRTPDPAEQRRPKILRRANLVDLQRGEVRPGELWIVDGRFVEPRGEPPAGAELIDLGGAYVLPGIINLHAHPGMMVGLRMDPNGMSAERVVHDLQAWLRYGVTTVQAMGTDRPLAFDVQRDERASRFLGARLFSVGHGFGTPGGVPPFSMDPPGPVRPTTPDEARRLVGALAERGASGVKIWYDDWYGQSPKMPFEIAAAILEAARSHGLTSYAHVYYVDDAKALVRAGLNVLAHMPRDREADRELVDVMQAHGAAVIPTLTVPESNVIFVDRPDWVADELFSRLLPPGSLEYLHDEAFIASIKAKSEFPELRPDLERARRNVRILYEGGVRFGFGTDTGVSNRVIGFYEHRELELLVGSGVRPTDALRMATADSAAILGQAAELGSLAPGHKADFVVLGANPLEDIRNTRQIRSVWLGGLKAADGL